MGERQVELIPVDSVPQLDQTVNSKREGLMISLSEAAQFSLIPPFDETGLLSSRAVEAYGFSSALAIKRNGSISGMDASLYQVEQRSRVSLVSLDKRRVTFSIQEDMKAAQDAHDNFCNGISGILDPDQKLVFLELNQSAIDLRFGGFGRYRREIEIVAGVEARTSVLDGILAVEGAFIPVESIRVKRSSETLAGLASLGVPLLWLRHVRELFDTSP